MTYCNHKLRRKSKMCEYLTQRKTTHLVTHTFYLTKQSAKFMKTVTFSRGLFCYLQSTIGLKVYDSDASHYYLCNILYLSPKMTTIRLVSSCCWVSNYCYALKLIYSNYLMMYRCAIKIMTRAPCFAWALIKTFGARPWSTKLVN